MTSLGARRRSAARSPDVLEPAVRRSRSSSLDSVGRLAGWRRARVLAKAGGCRLPVVSFSFSRTESSRQLLICEWTLMLDGA